jgi:hypothetical protein
VNLRLMMSRLARVAETPTVTIEFDAVQCVWRVRMVVDGDRYGASGADLATVVDSMATCILSARKQSFASQ